MLYGRAEERAAVEALLERARAGHGGGLVVRGEPGIGKTALLGHAAACASGMRVLRTAGAEPESDLGYATLHRLLLPVLDRATKLPDPQARALDVVFGRATGPPPDRFLVALATLTLLSETATDQPLACLVDDVHWADLASLGVLTFVARRLDAEPIALLLAARADEERPVDTAGLDELSLAGLHRQAARELLLACGGDRLAAPVQEELLRVSAGNALAIRELARGGWQGAGEPPTLGAGLRRAFLERARRHGPAALRLLVVAAADGSGRLATIRRAAAILGYDANPLTGGELDELVVVDGPWVGFRHPLMRAAVYQAASPAERRAAHRALAAALESEPAEADRRAWHLGQASDAPDEEVATELAHSAERAMTRGGAAAAVATLERAAALSVSPARRARHLVAAASARWQSGDAPRAGELLAQAEQTDPGAADVRLDIAELRAVMELRSGTPADAVALLMPLLPEALRGERRRAVGLLMLTGEAAFQADAAGTWEQITAAVADLPLDGDDVDDVLGRLFRAACRARAGVDLGLAPGDLDVVAGLTDPAQLAWAGGMAWGIGELDLGRRLRHEAVRRARALGAAGTLAWALEYLAVGELARGRYDTAEAHAEEGCRFAEETGQPNTACRQRSLLALLAALRGRERPARQLAEEALAEAGGRRLAGAIAMASQALGLLDLVAGRPEEALDHLDPIGRDRAATHPGLVLYSVPELVEAAVRAGRPQRAAEPLRRFVTWAQAADTPELLALAERCRALAADGEATEAHYRRALELHARADRPLEQARTALLLGEHLRRARRRAEARPYLREALATFRQLGATGWAARAAEELRATGERARRRTPDTATQLTPQEWRIVAAVGEGATNREIAAQLFLSPRTVDYHLRKVFQKLGISSRAELIRHAQCEL